MTAPVVEAAPVVETQAPTDTVPPVTEQAEPQTMSSVIDTIANRAVPTDDAPVATEQADGAGDVPVAEGEGEEDNSPMVTLIQFDEPDGQIDLRSRDPDTGQFREMDSAQSFEFSMKDKQTGETRSYNKTLPELVRLAKDGIAHQRAAAELSTYRDAVPQMQTLLSQKDQEIAGLRALAEGLLTGSVDHVNAQRNAYAAEMTPERLYQRRMAELNQREASLQAQQATSQQTYIDQQKTALNAALDPVIKEVEGIVGQDLAAGRLMRDTAHLMVNGQFPPQNFAALQSYVLGPYREWGKGEAAKRSAASTEQEKAKANQRAAQAAVRAAGAATRPATVASGASSAQPVGKAPVGLEKTIEAIIHRPVPAEM